MKFIFFLGTLYASPVQTGKEAAVRLFGFSLWYLSAHLISKLGNIAIEEAYLGTAEQALSTKTPPWQLLIGIILSEIMLSLAWIILFLVCAAAMIGFSDIWKGTLALIGNIAVFCGISLLGMIGIGVFILGLSFRLKQVGAVTEVLLYYLLMFSGFFLSPKLLPSVFHILNSLSPLSWAVQGMRAGWQALVPASLVSCFWILVGASILRWQWNWARKTGRLGSYV
ncbi:ABC transporter permease [Symbiobacterium thermophilum]|uniref:ABC transporter permease n=1 Tax=Symbiobacterium thermophilum TaxID=2734 RepID=UPI003081102F